MIIAPFPVARFFPASQYKQVCSANKELTPMFLIALNQPLAEIKKNIQLHEGNNRQWNCRHPIWKVTPLHVAVWSQSEDVVKYLISEKKCKTDIEDAMGFLPIHYAEALDNPQIVKLLQGATKVNYASHAALWGKLLTPPAEDPARLVFAYVNDAGQTIEGNSEQFTLFARGASFTPAFFFRDRKALLEQLAINLDKVSRKAIPSVSYHSETIAKLEASRVPLCLAKQESAGWGVAATTALDPFIPIVIYGGMGVAKEDIGKTASSGDYLLDFVEAHRFRNLGGMINEGFPNCVFDSIFLPSGISYPVIVPFRSIAKGEGLFVNYLSKHSIKKMNRLELNLDEARDFLRQGLLKICTGRLMPLIEQMKSGKIKSDGEGLREFVQLSSKVNFVLRTRSVLIPFILDRTIAVRDLKTLVQEEKFLPLFENDRTIQKETKGIVDCFETFERLKEKVEWDAFEEIKIHLVKLSGSYHAETVYVAAFHFLGFMLKEQLGWNTPIPKMALGMIFNSFEPSIPVFEITRTCLHQQRDATEEEIVQLQEIKNGHQGIGSLYQSIYAKAELDSFPRLKAFIGKVGQMNNEPTTPEENMMRVISMMKAMIPKGAPQEARGLFDDLESDPDMQASLFNFLKTQNANRNK